MPRITEVKTRPESGWAKWVMNCSGVGCRSDGGCNDWGEFGIRMPQIRNKFSIIIIQIRVIIPQNIIMIRENVIILGIKGWWWGREIEWVCIISAQIWRDNSKACLDVEGWCWWARILILRVGYGYGRVVICGVCTVTRVLSSVRDFENGRIFVGSLNLFCRQTTVAMPIGASVVPSAK